MLSGIQKPQRDVRRSFPRLMEWFEENWARIAPVLSLVALRDANDRVIDGRRELADRYSL
jgi:hypothetical protein